MSFVIETMFKVLFSVVIASNLVGNSLVLLVVLLNRRMQTPMNCLLANLALADFFVGLFLMPRTLFNDLYTHPGGWLGDLLCKMFTHACFTYLAAVASMLTLMFIAWERYYAVMYPHSSRGRINASKLRLLIAVSWLVAFGYASLEFWIIKFDEQRKVCFYDWSETLWKTDVFMWCIGLSLIPLGIQVGLYSRVVYRLWGKKTQTIEISQRSLMTQRKRLTKTVLLISIINIILRLPIDLHYFLSTFAGDTFTTVDWWEPVSFSLSHLMLVLNSAVNPVIYALQDRTFRKRMWCLMKNGCVRSSRVMDTSVLEVTNKLCLHE